MKIMPRLFVNKPFVFLVACCFAAACSQTFAESYTVRGPDGNTITVTDDTVSGNLYGTDYAADENSAYVEGHEVGSGGGGGDDDNTGAILVGVAVVAVLAGLGYWWYRSHKNKQLAETEQDLELDDALICHQLSETASIEFTPRLTTEFDVDPETAAGVEVADLAAGELSLRVRF